MEEKKEVEEVNVGDSKKGRDQVKLKKSTLWMITSGILGVLLVISIATAGFKGGGGAVSNKDGFIFMNSDACTTACDAMEPVAKEIAEKCGLKFSKAKYSQPVQVPGYVLVKDGILTISGINDKESFIQQMCKATDNKEVCEEAEEAQEEAEKETLKSAERKCEEMKKVEKPKLEVFYVSRCPYGIQAINSLYYVHENFGDKVDIIPRLLVNKAPDGKSTTSMHGEQEHIEDLRHICLREEQPDVYWDYMHCYVETGKPEECEKTAKVDSGKLAKCDGEKYALKDADDWVKIYQPAGGRGSPSFFLNRKKINEYDFSKNGRSPDNLKNVICCSMEDKIDECDTTLITNNPPTGFGKVEGGTASDVAQATC